MSDLVEGIKTGLRNAAVALGLAVLFFLLAIPAFRDLERLFIGLGVLSGLVGLAIVGFTTARERERG